MCIRIHHPQRSRLGEAPHEGTIFVARNKDFEGITPRTKHFFLRCQSRFNKKYPPGASSLLSTTLRDAGCEHYIWRDIDREICSFPVSNMHKPAHFGCLGSSLMFAFLIISTIKQDWFSSVGRNKRTKIILPIIHCQVRLENSKWSYTRASFGTYDPVASNWILIGLIQSWLATTVWFIHIHIHVDV